MFVAEHQRSEIGNMPEIQKLSKSVVNKIAAGEVIERPASVVKELMENSIDAGATRVDVTVEKGGTELIRIVDNGCGVTPEQITLTVESHGSKVRFQLAKLTLQS